MKILLLLLLFPVSLFSQDTNQSLDEVTDRLFTFDDNENENDESYESLALLLAHPLNLNKASAEELRFLKVLSETQIKNLLQHRNENGNFISTLELQSVPGFDLQTIDQFLPFIKISDPSAELDNSFIERIKKASDHYFLLRYEHTLETKKGFSATANDEQRFNGSPGKIYSRFRSSRPGDFSFGFTAEKDPGEKMMWNPSANYYGFDYLSYHAQIQHKGIIKNMIVGDYQAQFGQGLTWGGIVGMGKGSETITTVRRSNIGFVPYTSAYEAGYLRGIATSLQLHKNIILNPSYSFARRDGTVQEEEDNVSSIQYTGLHRNATELSRRKSFHEQTIGAVLQYQNAAFDAGVIVQHLNLSKPVAPNPQPYNYYAFREETNTNTGVYLNYTFQNISLFSEFAQTLHSGSGYIVGSLLSLTPKLDLAMVHRNFDKDFYTFYSNAFSESTKPQNERGTYWGWKYRFNRRWSYSGYLDLFRFPNLKYRTYAPSTGYEWLLRINWQPSRHILLFIQAREENKSKNKPDAFLKNHQIDNAKKNNYWISVDYGSGRTLRMKSRIQFSTYRFNNSLSRGIALAQDFSFQHKKFKLTTRYALFDTEDYDNRQYIYEQDVWLAYSLPAYQGKGIRKYIIIEYKMNKHLTLWLRYSGTRYTDRELIGSSLDRIEGNTKSDLKFQLRVRF